MNVSISQVNAPALCTGGRWYKTSPCIALRTDAGIFCMMLGKYAFPARYYLGVPEMPGQKVIVLLTADAAGPACMACVLAIARKMVGAHAEPAPSRLVSGERACLVAPDLAGASPLRADVPPLWNGGAQMVPLDRAQAPVAVTDATIARVRSEFDSLKLGDPATARPAAPKRTYPRRMPPAKRAPAAVPAHVAVPGAAPGSGDPDYARALHVLLHGNPAAAAMISDAALPAAVNLACAIDFIEAAGGAVTAWRPQDAALAPPSAAFTPDRQFLLDWALRRHARASAPLAAAAPLAESPECASPSEPASPAEPTEPAAPAAPEPIEDEPAPRLKFRTGTVIAVHPHDDHFRVVVCIQFQNKATHVLARSLTVGDVARITGQPVPAGVSAFNVMYIAAFLMVCAYAAERPTMGFTLWTEMPIPDVALGRYALRDLPEIAPNLRVIATEVLSASPKNTEREAAARSIANREARAISNATKRPWGSDEWELRFLAPREIH